MRLRPLLLLSGRVCARVSGEATETGEGWGEEFSLSHRLHSLILGGWTEASCRGDSQLLSHLHGPHLPPFHSQPDRRTG